MSCRSLISRCRIAPSALAFPLPLPAILALAFLVLPDTGFAAEQTKHPGYEFAVGESRLKFYGFTRVDVAYTDSRTNDPQIVQWIRSESSEPTSGTSSAEPDDPELTIHPKLARFGFDMVTPPVARLGDAKASGKIEVDFYNAAASESRAALRMRHAYMKLAWSQAALTAGQLTDLISPLFPAVNNDMVMWNAGNLGDRRPQIRFEVLPTVGEGTKLALQAMLGQTGAIDGQSLDGGSGPAAHDGVDAAVPTLQGRLGWTGKHFWLPEKSYEIGVWGHTATEALPDGAAPIAGEDEWSSSVFGFDLRLPLHDRVWIEAEGWTGKNLDDVRGGIGQGVNNAAYASKEGTVDDENRGKEIEATGGWAQLTVQASPVYAISLGGSFDDPEDNLPEAGARDANTVLFVANRVTPGGGITFGLDYLNWKTEWTGGAPDGEANRLNLFGQYSF